MSKHLNLHKSVCLKLQIGQTVLSNWVVHLFNPTALLSVEPFRNGLWIWERLHTEYWALNSTPQTYNAPLSTWFPPKTLWLIEGPGGGGCADSGFWLDSSLAAAGIASSAAAAAHLCCRAVLSVMGGARGQALVEEGEGGQAVKKHLHLPSIVPLWCALFQKAWNLFVDPRLLLLQACSCC